MKAAILLAVAATIAPAQAPGITAEVRASVAALRKHEAALAAANGTTKRKYRLDAWAYIDKAMRQQDWRRVADRAFFLRQTVSGWRSHKAHKAATDAYHVAAIAHHMVNGKMTRKAAAAALKAGQLIAFDLDEMHVPEMTKGEGFDKSMATRGSRLGDYGKAARCLERLRSSIATTKHRKGMSAKGKARLLRLIDSIIMRVKAQPDLGR